LGLFEWSAAPECDIWDREGWAQAIPSLGHPDASGTVFVTEESIASKAALVGAGGKEGIPEHVFRTENLASSSLLLSRDRFLRKTFWRVRMMIPKLIC